jgi:hypothetical protein
VAVPNDAPTGRLFQGALAANGRSKLPHAAVCAANTAEAEQLAVTAA